MKKHNYDNGEEQESKRICSRCVNEPFLRNWIDSDGTEDKCSYCDRWGKSVSVSELADKVEIAFSDYYERTSTEPDGLEYLMMSDKESVYNRERKGDEVLYVIEDIACIDETPASDILSILEEKHSDFDTACMGEESEFDKESYYQRKKIDCRENEELWGEFERSLRSEGRFFNKVAQDILDYLFSDLSELHTADGNSVIMDIGPGTTTTNVFRARVFQGEEEKLLGTLEKPWERLGPPPAEAANAGRMNANGISVFYGADTIETAIAEVRSPVGSRVVVAKFEITRRLRLLNVNALMSIRESGSIFNPDNLSKVKRARFMESLSRRIVRPVMPNDEARDYLATQAIADYLASKIGLDGMRFSSVQTGHSAFNFVLFHHSAKVEEADIPNGTKIEANLFSYNEDENPEYHVLEILNQEKRIDDKVRDIDYRSGRTDHLIYDTRKSSLRVDTNGISVFEINKAEYRYTRTEVTRFRWNLSQNTEARGTTDMDDNL